jgi:hypothetical protein
MPDPGETAVLVALREALSGDTRLAQHLALLEPTKTLARLFADEGASMSETHLSSIGMPNGGLSSHCSRESSEVQVTREQGDSRNATSSLPR